MEWGVSGSSRGSLFSSTSLSQQRLSPPGSRAPSRVAPTQLRAVNCPSLLCSLSHSHRLQSLPPPHWTCHGPTWGWYWTSGTWTVPVPGERLLGHGLGSSTCRCLRLRGRHASNTSCSWVCTRDPILLPGFSFENHCCCCCYCYQNSFLCPNLSLLLEIAIK